MIYNLTHSDNYFWYLILRGKQKQTEKKLRHPNTKFLHIIQMDGTINLIKP